MIQENSNGSEGIVEAELSTGNIIKYTREELQTIFWKFWGLHCEFCILIKNKCESLEKMAADTIGLGCTTHVYYNSLAIVQLQTQLKWYNTRCWYFK